MPAIPATAELFSTWAETGRAEGMERGHFVRAVQALEAMEVRAGDRCLDLGCGNGWATRWMAERAGSAHGIDASPAMVERARSVEREAVTFEVRSFTELPWPGRFDHAFSMEALYYAADLDAALRAIAVALAPGGQLTVVTDFYAENPHCHDWPERMGIPMNLLSEAGWAAALERAGLAVEACWRCLDPRPVDGDKDPRERSAEQDFRRNVGALALRGRKPA